MARKNLLTGLTDIKLPAGNSAQEPPPAGGAQPLLRSSSASSRGAIGAVSRSFEQLRSQAVVEIPPSLIDDSAVRDRLGVTAESHNALVASLREHGQQVPILVRPHPTQEGRYQVAYGRRRIRACEDLGRSVRAVVRSLTDEELVVAQGQENSAREDLSFIEKALFAAQLEESGYGRETIMAALSVDKTGLSRLISSAVRVPRDIIEAVGPAAKTGRDRWVELATRLERASALDAARKTISEAGFGQRASDDRFGRLYDAVASPRATTPRAKIWKAEDGTRVARVRDQPDTFALLIDKKAAPDFGDFLFASLPEIYAAFKRRGDA